MMAVPRASGKSPMAEKSVPQSRELARNRRARFEFEIVDVLEAGMALNGPEVKSVRAGRISLDEAWIRAKPDGLWLEKARIAEYAEANRANGDPVRPRRLLVHHREATRLLAATREEGLQLIPLAVRTRGRWIKVEIAICRSKDQHDKRQGIKNREAERDLRRAVRKRA
jgi:SsrA-binding protein